MSLVICNGYLEKVDKSLQKLYKSKADFNRINDLEFNLKSHNVIKSPGQCLIKKSIISQEWLTNIMKINGADDFFLWILLLEKGYIHKYTGINLSERKGRKMESNLELIGILKK